MSNVIVHVFGKGHGCSKCDILKKRLHDILEQPEYRGKVEFAFSDVLTEDGLVDFLKAEVLNPNRIPAILMQYDTGEFIFQDHDKLGMDQYKASCTGHVMGLQTDYSNGGTISPNAIKGLLDRALEAAYS